MRPSLLQHPREFQAPVAGVPTTPTGYHQWHRSLAAELARFASRDPLGHKADVNLYEYVWDSPTNRTDPTGEQFVPGTPNSPYQPPGGRWPYPQPTPPVSSQCHGDAYYWAMMVWMHRSVYLSGLLTPAPPADSNPYMHCVWNCSMAGTVGTDLAESESAKKEAVDVAICSMAHSISNSCWQRLSKRTRHTLAAFCCSAEQPSDYRDNATGRACACARSYWTTTMWNCTDCCTQNRVGPGTHDGPNDPIRPCGPHFSKRDEESYDEDLVWPQR
jgi:RHS repeat-associated protein